MKIVNFLTFMKENKFICHIDNSNEYTRSQKYANGWKYSYIDYFYTKNLECKLKTSQIQKNIKFKYLIKNTQRA